MNIHIYQTSNELTFLLKEGNRTIKKEVYKSKEELSKEFLNFLDKFLKSVRIEITDIKSFKLWQSRDVGFTAKRVLRAIVNALGLSKWLLLHPKNRNIVKPEVYKIE